MAATVPSATAVEILPHLLHPDITCGTDAGNGESFGKTRLTAIFPLFYRLRKSRTSGMFPYPDVRLYNDHTPCGVPLIRKEYSRRRVMLSGNPEQRISKHSGCHIKRKSSEITRFQNFLGGDKRDRTADLLNTLEAVIMDFYNRKKASVSTLSIRRSSGKIIDSTCKFHNLKGLP